MGASGRWFKALVGFTKSDISRSSRKMKVPKRKKPRHVKYEVENSSRTTTISSNIKPEVEAPTKSIISFGDHIKSLGSAEGNSFVLDSANPQPRESNASLDLRLAEKKENKLSKEESILPKVESSGFRSEGDGATTSGAKLNSLEKEKFEIDLMEAKPLLKDDRGDATVIETEEKKKHRSVAEIVPHKFESSCELKLDLDKLDHVV